MVSVAVLSAQLCSVWVESLEVQWSNLLSCTTIRCFMTGYSELVAMSIGETFVPLRII